MRVSITEQELILTRDGIISLEYILQLKITIVANESTRQSYTNMITFGWIKLTRCLMISLIYYANDDDKTYLRNSLITL